MNHLSTRKSLASDMPLVLCRRAIRPKERYLMSRNETQTCRELIEPALRQAGWAL